MQLACFTEDAYNSLLYGINKNENLYYGNQDWLESVLSGISPYYTVSRLSVEEFVPEIIEGKNDSEKSIEDLKNTRLLYDSFKGLTPAQATNKYMWTFLCHTKYKKYVKSRWLSQNDKRQNRTNTIKERFFVENNTKLLNDNALSRLWWYGHLTYDKNNTEDHYHLTKILFINQTICTDVIDTFNRMSFNRISGVLHAIEQINTELGDKNKGKLVSLFRSCKKYLNHRAAICDLDSLDSVEIQKLAYDYMIKEYCKS